MNLFRGIILQFLMGSTLSWALDPVIFGPEFTFMPNPGVDKEMIFGQMENHLINDQPEGCKFTTDLGYEDRRTFYSPNGWWCAVYRDSGGVEANMKPMPVSEYKRFQRDINDAIFVSAANVGMFPALWQGGGHINIDVGIFKKNPLLFRNFIVDLLNHNELFMGVFNYDYNNAAPMQLSTGGTMRLYGSFEGEPREDVLFEGFMQAALPQIDKLWKAGTLDFAIVHKIFYHLMNFGYAIRFWQDEPRLEIRAVRPQTSLDVFIRQIELFERRLQFLEKLTTPLPYRQLVPVLHMTADPHHVPPVQPELALRAFYQYVKESGLEWTDHRDYLWPQWHWNGDVEKFEASDWFKNQNKMKCANQLDQ